MIDILLLSSVFLIALLIGCIVLISTIYEYCKRRDVHYSEKFNKLERELGVIKKLIKEEVSDILKNIKKAYGQD